MFIGNVIADAILGIFNGLYAIYYYVIVCLLVCSISHADTVYLKNGKVIEDAKVIKIDKEKKIVVIEAYGGTTELNMLELDRIEQSDGPEEIKKKSSIAENEKIIKSKDSLENFYQAILAILERYRYFHTKCKETFEYYGQSQNSIGTSIRLTEINDNLKELSAQLNTFVVPQEAGAEELYKLIIKIVKLNIEINEIFTQGLSGKDFDMEEYLEIIKEHDLTIREGNKLVKKMATEKIINEFEALLDYEIVDKTLMPREKKAAEALVKILSMVAIDMDIPKSIKNEISMYLYKKCKELNINLNSIYFRVNNDPDFPIGELYAGYSIYIKPLNEKTLFYNVRNICEITIKINETYNLNLVSVTILYGESPEGKGKFVTIYLSDFMKYLEGEISKKGFISKWIYT